MLKAIYIQSSYKEVKYLTNLLSSMHTYLPVYVFLEKYNQNNYVKQTIKKNSNHLNLKIIYIDNTIWGSNLILNKGACMYYNIANYNNNNNNNYDFILFLNSYCRVKRNFIKYLNQEIIDNYTSNKNVIIASNIDNSELYSSNAIIFNTNSEFIFKLNDFFIVKKFIHNNNVNYEIKFMEYLGKNGILIKNSNYMINIKQNNTNTVDYKLFKKNAYIINNIYSNDIDNSNKDYLSLDNIKINYLFVENYFDKVVHNWKFKKNILCNGCQSEATIKCKSCNLKYCESCFNWIHKIKVPMKFIVKNNRKLRNSLGNNKYNIIDNNDEDLLIKKYNNLIRTKELHFKESSKTNFIELWKLIPDKSIKIYFIKLLSIFFYGGFYMDLDLKIKKEFISDLKSTKSNIIIFKDELGNISDKIFGTTNVRNIIIKNIIDQSILKLKQLYSNDKIYFKDLKWFPNFFIQFFTKKIKENELLIFKLTNFVQSADQYNHEKINQNIEIILDKNIYEKFKIDNNKKAIKEKLKLNNIYIKSNIAFDLDKTLYLKKINHQLEVEKINKQLEKKKKELEYKKKMALEKIKLENEHLEKEKKEKEKKEKERLEKKKLENERLEKERLEIISKLEHENKERIKNERLALEKLRREREKIAKEKRERDRIIKKERLDRLQFLKDKKIYEQRIKFIFTSLKGDISRQIFQILNIISLSHDYNIDFRIDSEYKRIDGNKPYYKYSLFNELPTFTLNKYCKKYAPIYYETNKKIYKKIVLNKKYETVVGNFQSYKYFWHNKGYIKKYLQIDSKKINLIRKKLTIYKKPIISIYVNISSSTKVSINYYKNALSFYKLNNYQIILFSDKILDAMKFITPLNINHIVSNKLFSNDKDHFIMMMLSDVVITSNSKFSLLACYFNEILDINTSAEYLLSDKWDNNKNIDDLTINNKFYIVNDNYNQKNNKIYDLIYILNDDNVYNFKKYFNHNKKNINHIINNYYYIYTKNLDINGANYISNLKFPFKQEEVIDYILKQKYENSKIKCNYYYQELLKIFVYYLNENFSSDFLLIDSNIFLLKKITKLNSYKHIYQFNKEKLKHFFINISNPSQKSIWMLIIDNYFNYKNNKYINLQRDLNLLSGFDIIEVSSLQKHHNFSSINLYFNSYENNIQDQVDSNYKEKETYNFSKIYNYYYNYLLINKIDFTKISYNVINLEKLKYKKHHMKHQFKMIKNKNLKFFKALSPENTLQINNVYNEYCKLNNKHRKRNLNLGSIGLIFSTINLFKSLINEDYVIILEDDIYFHKFYNELTSRLNINEKVDFLYLGYNNDNCKSIKNNLIRKDINKLPKNDNYRHFYGTYGYMCNSKFRDYILDLGVGWFIKNNFPLDCGYNYIKNYSSFNFYILNKHLIIPEVRFQTKDSINKVENEKYYLNRGIDLKNYYINKNLTNYNQNFKFYDSNLYFGYKIYNYFEINLKNKLKYKLNLMDGQNLIIKTLNNNYHLKLSKNEIIINAHIFIVNDPTKCLIIYKLSKNKYKLYINKNFIIDISKIIDIDLLEKEYYDCSINIPISFNKVNMETLINFDYIIKKYLKYNYQINIIHTDYNIDLLDKFILEKEKINYIYVENRYNFNLGYTRNLYKYLNLSNNILFTDVDIPLEEDQINIMIDQLLIYDIVKPYDKKLIHLTRDEKYKYLKKPFEINKEPRCLFTISGGIVLMKKKVLDYCGGYEELNCYGCEDRFLDVMIINKGFKIKKNEFNLLHLWHDKLFLRHPEEWKKLEKKSLVFNKKYYNCYLNLDGLTAKEWIKDKDDLHCNCNHNTENIDSLINHKKKYNFNLNLFENNQYLDNIILKPEINLVFPQKILFIMGNGPSLKEIMNTPYYLQIIKNNHSFGLNSAYRAYEKYNFYPTYFGCFDYVVNESHKESFENLVLGDNKIKEFYFIGNTDKKQNLYKKEVRNNKKFKKFNFINLELDKYPCISKSFEKYYNPGSSGANALQIGIMKGYKKIVLLGCDCNYVEEVDGVVHYDQSKYNRLELTKNLDNNPNYWFAGYQQKGDKFNLPNTNKFQIGSWKNISKFIPTDIKIINCSMISKIPYFKKYNFSSLNFKKNNISSRKVLIFTDSRGQYKASFSNKNIFTKKLHQYFKNKNIQCDMMLCPFKWTSTIDFIQCIEEKHINPDIYDIIILYTGVVEYSPRPLSNFYEAFYKYDEKISIDRLIKNKPPRILNNKKQFFINFFGLNNLNIMNYDIKYNEEDTRSLINLKMHELYVIPYLQRLNNKLLFINSNKIVEGWEGNYLKKNPLGRPKNINIINTFSKINKNKFKNIIDLSIWNNEDIKKYTVDNMHLTYKGSEYIYNEILKILKI